MRTVRRNRKVRRLPRVAEPAPLRATTRGELAAIAAELWRDPAVRAEFEDDRARFETRLASEVGPLEPTG